MEWMDGGNRKVARPPLAPHAWRHPSCLSSVAAFISSARHRCSGTAPRATPAGRGSSGSEHTAVVPKCLLASVLSVEEREEFFHRGWWVAAPAFGTVPALQTTEAHAGAKLGLEIKQAELLVFLRAEFDFQLRNVLTVRPVGGSGHVSG